MDTPTLQALMKNNPDLAARNPEVTGPLVFKAQKMEGRRTRQHPEEDFQQQIIDLAHLHGWRVAHFRTVRIQRKDGSVYYATPVQADGEGFPDLILLRGMDFIVAEIKSATGRCSKKQTEWLNAWELAGAFVYVWRPKDWEFIEKRLKR